MAAIPFKEKQRNKRIRERVRNMYSQIVSEVDPENVFDLLIEKRVISIEQKQKFMIKVTRKDRCRALLDHLLLCSNDESFIVLRDALEDQYPWIVERIDQSETDNETTCISDAKSDQNKVIQAKNQEHTQTKNQEQSKGPVHVNLPFDEKERLKKEFGKLEIENRHLEQKLEESRVRSETLAQELQESRKESKHFEQRFEESKTGSKKLEQELQETKNLKQEIQESRIEITNLEHRLQESRKESKHFEQNLKESRKENKNLEQKLEASKKETYIWAQKLQESRTKIKNFEQQLEKIRKERENVEQELKESRKETAEMKKHYRILKKNFDKALDCEKNLKKELGEVKRAAIYWGVEETPDTTSKSSKSQQSHATPSSESSNIFDSKVFVFGIDDGESVTKDIIEINLIRSDDVSKVKEIPAHMIDGSAAAVLCDSIFVTGIGQECDEIWSFNVTSSKWKNCASLVQGRQYHSVAFVDQVLYICGGFLCCDKKTLLDDVEAYDTHKDQCVTVGKLAFAFYSSGNCVPFKSSLYIFGGCDANRKIINKVQVYDTKLNTCTLLSEPMPITQCLLRAVLWKNTVILLGYNGCFTFNFETQVWQVRYYFKTDVDYFGLIISNGLLFVIGGGYIKKDADGNLKWICRDDVRCIPLVNILKNEPIDWRHHATLPKPSFVHTFGKLDLCLK